jgi:hypothetical protein
MKIRSLMGIFALTAALVGCSGSDSTMGSPAPAASGTTAQASALYSRLGEHDGIAKAIDAIVAQELMDPEIASYFVFQTMSPVPAGHPSKDQIEECFVAQLGQAAGGPETYPMMTTGGFECRGMVAAHAKLGVGIPEGVFTKFLTIAASVLKSAGVSDEDIGTIAGVLKGQHDGVVQDKTRTDGPYMATEN